MDLFRDDLRLADHFDRYLWRELMAYFSSEAIKLQSIIGAENKISLKGSYS